MKRTLKIAIALIILINLIASPLAQCIYAVSEGMQETKDSSHNGTKEVELGESEIKEMEVGDITEQNIKTEDDVEEYIETEDNVEEYIKVGEDVEQVESSNMMLGKLELEIILRLPTEERFNVELQKEGNITYSQEERKENKVYYHFDNLEEGIYILKVQGNNYITYTQELKIGDEVTKIVLSNGHSINDILIEGQTKYGVVGIGDITGDGLINEEDEKLMIEKIEEETYDEKYDLNKDQIIDIVDLSYIVFNKNKNIEATPIQMLKLTEDNVQLKGTIISEGDVASIFENNNKYLQLKTKNGQDISESNALEIELNIEKNKNKTEAIIIKPPVEKSNAIQQGEAKVTYVDEQGIEEKITVKIGNKQNTQREKVVETAMIQSDGSIVIDLGVQIVIKRVTIKVTKTTSNKLVEIAKIEFLNDIKSKIPEPEIEIPENLEAISDSEEFTLKWKNVPNITGYEVEITANGKAEVLKTEINNITVSSFNNNKIENGTTYTVKVQSVNGEWKSRYSKEIEIIPQSNKVPDAPENLNVEGAYRTLKISWNKMDSTDSYNIYYREYEIGEYIKVAENITTNNYILTGLKERTVYQVYITGNNRVGEGSPSIVNVAETVDVNPPITTNYKLINKPIEGITKTANIASVEYIGGEKPENEFAVVDNDYTTAWSINTWDTGVFNTKRQSPIVEFYQTCKIGNVIVVAKESQGEDYFYGKTQYWDEDGKSTIIYGQFTKKISINGKTYYEFEYATPIMAKKIQINFALDLASLENTISIAEMKFYEYDELIDEIANLYTDKLCLELRDEVTEQTIVDLEIKLNTKEEISGEYSPKREMLQKKLNLAREILNSKEINIELNTDAIVKLDINEKEVFQVETKDINEKEAFQEETKDINEIEAFQEETKDIDEKEAFQEETKDINEKEAFQEETKDIDEIEAFQVETLSYYIDPKNIKQLNGLPTKVKKELYIEDDEPALEEDRIVKDSSKGDLPRVILTIETNEIKSIADN